MPDQPILLFLIIVIVFLVIWVQDAISNTLK